MLLSKFLFFILLYNKIIINFMNQIFSKVHLYQFYVSMYLRQIKISKMKFFPFSMVSYLYFILKRNLSDYYIQYNILSLYYDEILLINLFFLILIM